MSGPTRAQMHDQVEALQTGLRQAMAQSAADADRAQVLLSNSELQGKRLTGENDDLRERLHTAELTIAHLRGKLSLLDEPPPAPAERPLPAYNRWESPTGWPDHGLGETHGFVGGEPRRPHVWFRRRP